MRTFLFTALLTSHQVFAGGPKVVNIINFIRGTEPRSNVDLLKPVVEQIKLAKKHGLPTTFLIQYDALVNPDFVNLLKSELGPDDEIGVWLEVVQPQVEAAGMEWKGRWPWDYNAAVGLTEAYAPEDRKKLMDVLMERFKSEFGDYPKSVGCWVLDAPTLNYLSDQYHIVAACNCKDQSGTDGYTLWGGYWNQAYYPSRINAFMPAQTVEKQLNVPIFRMLGSDPVYQYDHNLGNGVQGVISLEPVYRPGGGSPDWVRWFFDVNFKAPNLAFAYTQAGQENSFGWPAMEAGLKDQYQLMEERMAAGEIRVETLAKSGAWYRENFETTPATAVVAMDDYDDKGHRSVWYESRFYRVNFYWEGDAWRIRDLHLFNEQYPERYLKNKVTGSTATYDTLPVMDGFHWSTSSDFAGFRPLVNTLSGTRQLLVNGEPTVTEVGTDGLLISMPVTTGGELKIHCNPDNLSMEITGASAPSDWGVELAWSPQQSTSIVTSSERTIGYQHNNFGYALRTNDAVVSEGIKSSSLLIRPDDATVTFDFDPANASAYWDTNGSNPGAGGPATAGNWNDSATNWTSSTAGTDDTVVWPGGGHRAIFSAGTDTSGISTVEIAGEQDAEGVLVEEGDVNLSGGSLNLATPAVVRAEEGASLTINTQLTGTSGLLLEGDGVIQLSGEHPLSGPIGITAPSLTLASGTSFPSLSDLSLGSGTSIQADSVLLGLTGTMSLNGASFIGSGSTTIRAQNLTLETSSNPSSLTLTDLAAIHLTAEFPSQSTFQIDGGSIFLSESASLTTDRWTNRGSNLTHTLEISDAAQLIISDDFVLGANPGAALTVNQTGGTVTNTGTTNNPGGDDASNRWGLWSGGANVTYNISAGSLNLPGAPLYLSWDSQASLNISGTAMVNLKGIELGWGGRSQVSAVRLTGGTLNIGSAGVTSGAATNKSFVLGGGTLGASANWASTVQAHVTAATSIENPSGDIAFEAGISGTGTLTKSGSSALIISGSTPYTGTLNAMEGTVRIGSSSPMKVNLAAGAVIAAGNTYAHGSGSIANLDLADGSSSTFRIGNSENSLNVSAAGGLVTAGIHQVHIVVAAGAVPGTYPLFYYNDSIGGDGAAAFSLSNTPGLVASLVDNTTTSSIDLLVTSVEPAEEAGAIIRELFDGIAGTPPDTSSTLNGKGNTATTIGLTGTWLTNGGNGIFTASNFNTGSGLSGLAPSQTEDGAVWNNSNSWGTSIYATRPLAEPIDFAGERILYFSFRADNTGDSNMGIGLASGPGGTAEFIGAGLSWDNARSIATGAVDAGNSPFISYGTLGSDSGPYGIRNHGPLGSVNGSALIVGRIKLNASAPDQIDIKCYGPGDTIGSDPSAITWTASDSVDTSMIATHLLLWLNGSGSNTTGELDAIRFGDTWESVTGAADSYQAWIRESPYFLTGSDAAPMSDPDGDGIPNAIEFVTGSNPATTNNGSRMPTCALVGDYYEFSYRRTERSNVQPYPFVEYSTNLISWFPAEEGAYGVVINEDNDQYGPGIDRVMVRIPRTLAWGEKLFTRLNSNR
ncbi:beta strand repeat-containing protein [Haloferula sargassicola]|uniref:beta strand repeat-containing protein n=1 Tax=Haloferula sargassicola TaxID=490096 RepID=UPI00336597DA